VLLPGIHRCCIDPELAERRLYAEVVEFIQPHPSLSELFGESVMALTGRSLNA